MGEPLDGGPPMLGARCCGRSAGAPINPVRRATFRAIRSSPESRSSTRSRRSCAGRSCRCSRRPGCRISSWPRSWRRRRTPAANRSRSSSRRWACTHADAATLRDVLETRTAAGDLALFLDTADDPVVQRILTPRVALTVAEHLAFELEQHVLVILADMTSYCEAVARSLGGARRDPGPARLSRATCTAIWPRSTNAAAAFAAARGSLTLVPVLTMPAGDITHPVPDLDRLHHRRADRAVAGAAGRRRLSAGRRVGSLSRLMRKGTGASRTRADHPAAAGAAPRGAGARAAGARSRRPRRRGGADRNRSTLPRVRARRFSDAVRRAGCRRDAHARRSRSRASGTCSPSFRDGS